MSVCALNGERNPQYVETELDRELRERGLVQYESGEPESEGLYGIATGVTSFVNSHSVMMGAARTWDPRRLLNGKFKLFKDIGGEGVMLHPRSGDRIFGFFLGLSNFYNKIREMGGRPIVLDVHLDHPFFKTAQNITLKNSTLNRDYPAVRIPYSSDMEGLFRNPEEFLEYCRKINLEVLWEDTLQPFERASWYHWSSRKKNILLIHKPEMERIRRSGLENITVENHPHESSVSPFFEKKSFKSRAVVFDGNLQEIQRLFSEGDENFRGLRIEQSSWNMVEYNGKVYLLENSDTECLFNIAERRDVGSLPFFRLEEKPIETRGLEHQGGAVVLSMNQTASFSSYSHEVLTFLLNGVNVFVYDNAGKGISQGKNSEYGMTETLRSAGEFLTTTKGFDQSQILYKGQCAGGLPTSEAGRMFPRSHIWVDQAPRTFHGTARDMFVVKSDDIITRATQNGSLFRRAVGGAVRLLPRLAAPAIGLAVSRVLPSYDVVTNFQQNQGKHIYTIGVPDESGWGGDQLVPHSHVEAIRGQLLSEGDRGLYLEMPGAMHVTDWWKDANVFRSVKGALKETNLSVDPYAIQMAGERAVIAQKFEALFGHSYDEETCSDLEYLVYDLIVGAYEGEDTSVFDFNILNVREEGGIELERAVVNACIDAAEEGKQEKALIHFIDYKRKNCI